MSDEYLSSLVGRSVQIYRGGPNSNTGILLSVNDDYLSLQKDDGNIIYYKTSHIKSIRENSQIRFNSILRAFDTTELRTAKSFNELCKDCKDQIVRINGKGPESKEGKLMDVKEDYIVLYTENEGLIFYKEHHITSISNVLTDSNEEEDEDIEGIESQEEEQNFEEANFMKIYEHIAAENTNSLLENLKYTWIKLNRKGPESMEGILVESNEEYLVLVVNNEVFRISTFHVKNFSVNLSKAMQEDNKKEETEQKTKGQNSVEQPSSGGKKNEKQTLNVIIQAVEADTNKADEEQRIQQMRRRNKQLKKRAQQQYRKKKQTNSVKTTEKQSKKKKTTKRVANIGKKNRKK